MALLPVLSTYFQKVTKALPDLLMIIAVCLMNISLWVNNGTSGVAYGGSILLETAVPYLMARAYLRNKIQLANFAKVYFLVILVLLPLVLYEAKMGTNVLKQLFRTGDSNLPEMRLGFYRSSGPLDHPILFGIFAASGISLAYSLMRKGFLKYIVILASAIASLSSAAYVMVAMQVLLLKQKILANARLKTYGILFAAIYIFISIFSNRSPLAVFASYLSLDKETAYFRILIYEYAMASVMNNPFLGIGLNDWARPEWMPPSIDSFYLLTGVRYGIPVLFCIVLIIYYALKNTYINDPSKVHVSIRILIMSLVVSAYTVHFWNVMYVFFWLMLGLAVNLKDIPAINDCRPST
jgi:hypothetical protein